DSAYSFRAAPGMARLSKPFSFPQDDYSSAAMGINAAGDVVGWAAAVTPPFPQAIPNFAAIWRAGTTAISFINLGGGTTGFTPTLSTTPSMARDIDDQGLVVGEFGSPKKAFVWKFGTPAQQLTAPGASPGATALALTNVNAAGALTIVGWTTDAGGQRRATQWVIAAP
ncbi:MAG TPA: hypothetical protein VF395_08460, partial [Polyangiaceae bacterium]